MRSSIVINALVLGAIASPITKRAVDFNWGEDQVLGVNLGGWLVLEPWITPSIFQQFDGFDTHDEWTLCENHPDQAQGILKNHWDSWVTKADFEKIADAGFNIVRIPIGYWAYQKANDPYVEGAAPYIDKAIKWARQTNLKVLIDLHGAPGSQNGYDNSGHNGTVDWLTEDDSLENTKAVIQIIANKYARKSYQDVVVGIQLLNEPLASEIEGGADAVVNYYSDAYDNVRIISDTPVVVHDAFQRSSFWDKKLNPPEYQGVIVDHHEYQIFTDKLINLSAEEHVERICSNTDQYSSTTHWVVVGEWSGAMTDCAAALNGYGLGSRWEGNHYTSKGSTGRDCGNINFLETWNDTLIENTRRYIEAQIDTYLQQTRGFFFWNFKTEGSPEWDMFRLLDKGIFPNLNNRKSSSICSS